jgi:peptide/nickel transport system permease protein
MRFKWKSFLPRSPGLAAAAAVLTAIAIAGIFAPWVAPYNPVEQPDLVAGRHLPPLSMRPAVRYAYRWELADRVERTPTGLLVQRLGKTALHPADEVLNLTEDGVADRRIYLLGSDRLSRDVFSRLVYGARVSLFIGFGSISLALVLGISIGALAALGPRAFDTVLMRVVDGVIALPWLVLLVFLVATFPGSGLMTMVILLGCTSWTTIARLVRGELLSLRQRDFVLAVRGLGGGMPYIFWHHLLPNALPPLLVDATLRIASLILLESTLSFLGFGIQNPQPSWGNMIAESRNTIGTAWWEGLFPGLALLATTISLSVAADALRDRLDPRHES